ncbi:alpha/beta hydrolase [Massilia arenosa]|uniref:Alpha/beta hydrolase n=1 Tax=Zemynaea arenosa TaxID=2561931 RepID=A0A4Y9SFJ6_9BURK|nr:alpha/beta hydrolase [Massilia arenosa]TFW18756.1 alpha/beta hydrolase [Massilia arenosa]
MSTSTSSSTPQRSAVTVNGMAIHVEQQGSGKPLVLLHGGIIPDCFGPNVAALAAGRHIIAPHLQAHGHTPDVDRPLRAETLADDVAALVRQLGLGKVDVLGYSFGAGVALRLALQHPDVVDRLVLVSAPMKRSGFFPEVRAAFDNMAAGAAQVGAQLAQSPFAATYPKVDWVNLFRKMGELTRRDYDLSAQVAALKTPTQLIYADADAISLEHIAEFYKALGGGQRDAGLDGSLRSPSRLAIIPGTTHYSILGTTAVADIARGFLAT